MSNVKTVFTGKKFHVERREVPVDGKPHAWEVIVHPGAAVILPVLPDGRIVLIRNYRVAVDEELLELPAGTLDDQEPPEACAARELAEETGYRAGRLEPLVTFYSTPGILNERLHTFVATDLTPGPTSHESGEQIRVTPMTLADALQAMRNRKISDGKTILSLLYYDRFVRGEGSRA